MFKKFAASAALAASALVLPSAANAAIQIGDSVTCTTTTGPENSSCDDLGGSPIPKRDWEMTSTNTVGEGVEFWFRATNADNPFMSIDFSNGILTLSSIGARNISATFLEFTSSRPFLDVTNGRGVLADKARVINGVLRIDLRRNYTENTTTTWNVTAVPEPGTWLLMILGLGAVGFSMRRRQATATRFQFA